MKRKICLSLILMVLLSGICLAADVAEADGDVKADSATTEDVLFNFDKEYEKSLFKSFRHTSIVENSGSVITIRSTGQPDKDKSDPAFFLTELSIDAKTHPYIVVKAKHTDLQKKELRLHYAVNGVHDSEQNLVKYLTNEYSMLVYDMAGRNGWDGTITELYFSLNGNVVGNVDIDWILFTDTVPEKMSSIAGAVDTSKFQIVNEEKLPFSDVANGAWYCKEVETAYQLGLVKGVDETHYNPTKPVSLAEVITLAVRMNCIYTGRDLPTSADGKWYDPYVKYAINELMIWGDEFPDYTAPALRGQVAYIMGKALPEEAYEPINMFNEIPDMPNGDFGNYEALILYNAGIVIGSDSEYNFRPNTEINRAEIAAIVNRMAKPNNRKRVITDAEREAKKRTFNAETIALLARFANAEEKTLIMKNGLATGRGTAQGDGKADPQVNLGNVVGQFNGKDIEKIVIGLKCDNINPVNSGALYYGTSDSPNASESKKMMPEISEPDENGIVTLTYDVTKHMQFMGTVTMLRFDPVATYDEFGIAYLILE